MWCSWEQKTFFQAFWWFVIGFLIEFLETLKKGTVSVQIYEQNLNFNEFFFWNLLKEVKSKKLQKPRQFRAPKTKKTVTKKPQLLAVKTMFPKKKLFYFFMVWIINLLFVSNNYLLHKYSRIFFFSLRFKNECLFFSIRLNTFS